MPSHLISSSGTGSKVATMTVIQIHLMIKYLQLQLVRKPLQEAVDRKSSFGIENVSNEGTKLLKPL